MRLLDLKTNETGFVESIDAGIRLFNRLTSMGICEGKQVVIVKNGNSGPIVFDIDETRFAIGRSMAEKITVRK